MLIQYKCMPPLPPTRFYRLRAPREDGAEITCAQSSLSVALFLRSHNILYMLHFIHAVFCMFSLLPLFYSYKCITAKRSTTTTTPKKNVIELELGCRSSRSICLWNKKKEKKIEKYFD